jgi:metal-sulfur cluster biosynthetic enzyme
VGVAVQHEADRRVAGPGGGLPGETRRRSTAPKRKILGENYARLIGLDVEDARRASPTTSSPGGAPKAGPSPTPPPARPGPPDDHRRAVHAALEGIVDPCSVATGVPLSILDMGLLRGVEVSGDEVLVDLRLTSPLCHQAPYFIMEVERRVGALAGVRSVVCRTDIGVAWEPAMMRQDAVRRLAARRQELDASRKR